MRTYFVLSILMLASCAPLEKSQPTLEVMGGFGKVTTIQSVTDDSGESSTQRTIVGALSGGVIGLALGNGTEDNIGKMQKHQYDLQMADGAKLTVTSLSIVGINDCVKMSHIGDHSDAILERATPQDCKL